MADKSSSRAHMKALSRTKVVFTETWPLLNHFTLLLVEKKMTNQARSTPKSWPYLILMWFLSHQLLERSQKARSARIEIYCIALENCYTSNVCNGHPMLAWL